MAAPASVRDVGWIGALAGAIALLGAVVLRILGDSWDGLPRTLGTIGANPSTFELGLLLGFGLLGYGLRRFHYPIAPVVVGLILGPLAEQQLRRALAISQGDPSVLVHSPVAVILYLIAAIAVLLPVYLRLRGKGQVLEALHAEED